MTAASKGGARVSVDKSGRPSPSIDGNDSQLRGLWAKNLIRLKLSPMRVARLMRVSRSQLYRDLEAASEWMERSGRLEAG